MKRRGEFDDMWSLTAAMNIPLYYRTKQRQAVSEAKASLSEARNELEATRLMIASNIRDSYSMLTSAQRLMELYRDGLIPKTTQDFESALAGYSAGKVDALTVISRLRALLEFETLYWAQFVEKEKAAARLDSMAGIMEAGGQ
jgi:outer membrane protein TolC